jgi:hypothetical protein
LNTFLSMTVERCLACEADAVGTVEGCLACEAESAGASVLVPEGQNEGSQA